MDFIVDFELIFQRVAQSIDVSVKEKISHVDVYKASEMRNQVIVATKVSKMVLGIKKMVQNV